MNFSSIASLFNGISPGVLAALNPQPLPPGPPDPDRFRAVGQGDTVSLNPQPLPPGPPDPERISRLSLGDRVSLNPQPLPPKDLFARFSLQVFQSAPQLSLEWTSAAAVRAVKVNIAGR